MKLIIVLFLFGDLALCRPTCYYPGSGSIAGYAAECPPNLKDEKINDLQNQIDVIKQQRINDQYEIQNQIEQDRIDTDYLNKMRYLDK